MSQNSGRQYHCSAWSGRSYLLHSLICWVQRLILQHLEGNPICRLKKEKRGEVIVGTYESPRSTITINRWPEEFVLSYICQLEGNCPSNLLKLGAKTERSRTSQFRQHAKCMLLSMVHWPRTVSLLLVNVLVLHDQLMRVSHYTLRGALTPINSMRYPDTHSMEVPV